MINLKKIINIKSLENSFFILAGFILCISAVLKGDTLLAIVSALFGLIYTFLLGRGKAIGYIFGMAGTLCGAYISFDINLYGFFALHLFYYFPMEVIGFFNWKKNTNSVTKEVIKTILSGKERFFLFLLSCTLTIITVLIFIKISDSSPVLDGLVTIFSLLGMYLSVKRTLEQWIIWTFVNFLSVLMWFKVYIMGEGVFSIFLVRIIYLGLGLYFYYKWFKELQVKK